MLTDLPILKEAVLNVSIDSTCGTMVLASQYLWEITSGKIREL